MYYRCVASDLKCEAHRVAQARADVLYRLHKKHFNGDRSDLRQTAVAAVLELAATPDAVVDGAVAEKLLLAAVDKAALASIKTGLKSRQLPEVVNEDGEVGQMDPPEPQRWPMEHAELWAQFQWQVDRCLSKTQSRLLWQTVVLGWQPAEIAAEHNKRLPNRPKWTAETVLAVVAEAKATVATATPKCLLRCLMDPANKDLQFEAGIL